MTPPRCRTPAWTTGSGSRPGRPAPRFALRLLFSYALSWPTVTVALSLRTPEVFNTIGTVAIFPLVFLSDTFVDTAKPPPYHRNGTVGGDLTGWAAWPPHRRVTPSVLGETTVMGGLR